MAALVVALDLLTEASEVNAPQSTVSRWKTAARMPELGMEELRALH